MKIQSISIKDIKPCERNAKRHPKEQIARIAKSIKEFGWQQPVVLDSSNTIVIGHGRYFAAKKLRMKEIPCVCATELTEQQASALRLADNKAVAAISMQMGMPTGKTAKAAKPRTSRTAKK